MIKQECIGIPDMILLLMIFCFKKIKIKAEIVLSPGGAYFLYFSVPFFRSRKKFSTSFAIVSFFFSRPFHENLKFLKNCSYDSNKIF